MIKDIPLERPTQQPLSSKRCERSIYVEAAFSTWGVVGPANRCIYSGGV